MNIIVAVNSDWGIGYNNTQTIVIPEDRRHFRKITTGGTVVVGKKTFEEIGRPLPNRKNIVLTRDEKYRHRGVLVAHCADEVLAMISEEETDKVFIIGGGIIYNLFFPMCKYAYITKIQAAPLSDTYIPNLDASTDWTLVTQSETGESTGIFYTFNLYKNTALNEKNVKESIGDGLVYPAIQAKAVDASIAPAN